MVQTQNTLSLGDSLRQLADAIDRAPGLATAMTHPGVPLNLLVGMPIASEVERFAPMFNAHVEHGVNGNEAETWFDMLCGQVRLTVYAIEPLPRELRRPVSVTERMEAAL